MDLGGGFGVSGKHQLYHILTERLRHNGEVLGQYPHAVVRMAGRKAEFHELAGVFLVAAQSSRIMNVMAPSKYNFASLGQRSISCYSQVRHTSTGLFY